MDLDTRVEDLLDMVMETKKDSAETLPHKRRRDKRASKKPSHIPYAGIGNVIHYGARRVKGLSEKERAQFNPPDSQVKKVQSLFSAISSGNPKWDYATEILDDLKRENGSIFPTRNLYQELLSQVATIVQQRAPVSIGFRRDKIYGFPNGFYINDRSG